MKKNRTLGIVVGILALLQLQAHASVTTWDELYSEADTASEASTISITSDLTSNGQSIGFLQKQLNLDFNGNVINGTAYRDDSPLLFAGAGSSETKLAIINATFQGFDTENGIVKGTNPLIELTDVSFLNNKGVAINNKGYNKLIINAENSDVTFKNNTDYGIKSNSSIYLNANDGKTITLDDAIIIDNNFDGNLIINNTLKANKDLNGTVILNKNVDFASSNGMVYLGAKSAYKNGTLKLGIKPANSNDFRLSVGGESTLNLQNDNVDKLTMSKFSGADDASLHLKLDYNAKTGEMDVIVVSDSAVGASTPNIIVDAINILVAGDARETKYLDGLGKTVIEVSKDTVTAIKGNETYIFNPIANEIGAYTVAKTNNIDDFSELKNYIQNQPDSTSIALSNNITLSEDLENLVGDDRDTTIYGNGFSINGTDANKKEYEGVSVKNGQTLGFNNITLKDFPNKDLIKNEGTTNLTKATLENVSIVNDKILNLNSTILNKTNITNNAINRNPSNKDGGIILTGENTFKSGFINTPGSNNGEIFVDSGTTTIENGFTINTLGLTVGQLSGSASSATLNNSGKIEVERLTLNKANLHNTGTITITGDMQDLDSAVANVINDGIISSNSGYYIGDKSSFKNNTGATLSGSYINNAGNLINEGKITTDVQNFWTDGFSSFEYGELTSNLDDITGLIYQVGNDNDGSIFNITGGTINNSPKIQNYPDQSGGIINILGTVKSLVRLDNFSGKTFVKNGGEVQIVGSEQSRIFTDKDITFEDGSTLNLRESTIPARLQFTPTNLILAENDTLNLKMKDGLTLYAPHRTAKGKFSLKELEISDGTSQDWQLIDDYNNSDIYGRTSLDNDFSLIKTASSASGVNSVMYNKFTGMISYGTKDLQSALDEVRNEAMSINKGSNYFYELKNDEESATGGFSSGRFIVNGSNNGVIKNTSIDINETGTLVLTNANLKDTKLSPSGNGQLVIRNSSGNEIKLDNTTINNSSNNGGVTFEGNSDINFNGEYIGVSPRSTAKVNLGNATLTRNGNDSHAYWNLTSGTLKYINDSYLANGGMNAITFNGGNLDLRNGIASNIPLYGLALNANSNIYVDVDLANQTMDKLVASNSSYSGGKLNVAGMTLLSDAINDFTSINFTSDDNLKSNIAYTGTSQVAYSPIYKYNVNYNQNNGNFEFSRGSGGQGGNASSAFNPAILAAPVGAQIGSYLTQLNIYEQAFANQDMLMTMTRAQRTSMKFANKYASAQGTGEGGVITFDPNQIPEQDNGGWFRPYATFEGVELKNGPSVRNIGYGSLFGGDTGIIEHRRGWDAVYSFYAGYNGSNQNYSNVSINQNGGTLGASGIWYKGNFYTGLTANVGANVAEAHTMYGNENFTMLATGIASKTGYNFELADGKFIIQPNYLMSYTFVNTFDYTNAAGIKVDSDPLHAIQIAPGLKFIGNLKNGWQPYIGLQMVWNIMDKTRFQANNVSLPNMSVDPYFQYGVGVQKRVGNRFTGFGQAMVRNGGRNGVALSFGFRWAIGK